MRFQSIARSLLLSIAVTSSFVPNSARAQDEISFGQIVDLLFKFGQDAICIEQGNTHPSFKGSLADLNLAAPTTLATLLHSGGFASEMRGKTLILYDAKTRESGDRYLLNRTIPNLSFRGASVEEILKKIGDQFGLEILSESSLSSQQEKMNTKFDLDLKGITLRDALFLLAEKAGFRTWSAAPVNFGNHHSLLVRFQ